MWIGIWIRLGFFLSLCTKIKWVSPVLLHTWQRSWDQRVDLVMIRCGRGRGTLRQVKHLNECICKCDWGLSYQLIRFFSNTGPCSPTSEDSLPILLHQPFILHISFLTEMSSGRVKWARERRWWWWTDRASLAPVSLKLWTSSKPQRPPTRPFNYSCSRG